MKKLFKTLNATIMVIILSLFITGCANSIESINSNEKQNITTNEKLYTQCNMHAYKGRVDTVNYSVGIFIPVNSEVTILDSNRKKIKFDYNGKTIVLINREKYSGLNIDQIFNRYFGKKKVDLSKFTKKERDAIKTGQVVKGMSKEAVLIALGHPPAHATPSLESNEWKYWKSRWNTMIVVFKNGKVIAIRD